MRFLATLAIGLFGLACSATDERPTTWTEDAAMGAASQRARDALPAFVERMAAEEPPSTRSILALVGSAPDARPLWLDEPVLRAGGFSAVVGHAPPGLPDLELGTVVALSEGEVLDWMFARAGCMAGGYTLRVKRARLPESERAAFDRALLVPFCTLDTP